MSKKGKGNLNKVIFGVLSFVMSVMLFVLSLSVILRTTLFNTTFIIESMNSSNYFTDKKDEIKRSLTDLGYASGLEEEFFDNVLDEAMIHDDTAEYIEEFYAGNGTKIGTELFRQRFNEALDKYILENNLNDVSETSREFMVNRAANIYKASLEFPLFSIVSVYILNIRNAMPYVIIGVSVLIVIITVILIFANKWKHRVFKYLAYAFGGAFLSVGVLPASAFLTGVLSKVNLSSRAFYYLFVQCGNNILIALAVCAAFFLLAFIVCVITHNQKRKKLME